MRAFISVDISKEVKEEIGRIQDKLPKFFGKRTEFENLHLTLKFLGEVDEKRIVEVKKNLRKIEFESFDSKIDLIGVFSEKFIRIIWLHLDNCEKLQKQVDEKLRNLFEIEKRFMSHLTVARVKKIENKYKFLKELKELKIPKIKFKVESFELKKSTLTEHGPIYETLEKYNLN